MTNNNDLLVDPYDWINGTEENDARLNDMLYYISNKIFTYRIDLHMTMKEFAKLLGISKKMVYKLERVDSNPTIKQLYEISEKLNIRFKMDI